ncbi:MAG: hypothetical protein J6K63_05740 [Clostridia bacterium]|nr:hypothetical protein [Clostridia bacterium]
MLLTNYDFYDIYWSIVLMRSDGLGYDYAVSKAIKDTIDAEQKDNIVEFNKIRSVLSDIQELKEYEKWRWILTKNVYTYGVKIIKDDFAYQVLSAMFEELLDSLKEPNEERINDLKIALHNIPIILADEHKRVKKRITREISSYRNKWNKYFLKNLVK